MNMANGERCPLCCAVPRYNTTIGSSRPSPLSVQKVFFLRFNEVAEDADVVWRRRPLADEQMYVPFRGNSFDPTKRKARRVDVSHPFGQDRNPATGPHHRHKRQRVLGQSGCLLCEEICDGLREMVAKFVVDKSSVYDLLRIRFSGSGRKCVITRADQPKGITEQ